MTITQVTTIKILTGAYQATRPLLRYDIFCKAIVYVSDLVVQNVKKQ